MPASVTYTYVAGVPVLTLTEVSDIGVTTNGAASFSPLLLSGTVFTGGSGTTTKPLVLLEPAGTPSTGWSTSGTSLGINNPTASSTVRAIDIQLNGSSVFRITAAGAVTIANSGGLFSTGAFTLSGVAITAAKFILGALVTPASAVATGVLGTIVADTGFIYVCTATDTWKRVAIATW